MASKERGIKLVDAITTGDMKAVDDLLSKDVDLNVQIKGDNAIHMAARKGRLGVIKKLKKKGDNLDRGNLNGNTPAHYAAREGHLDIIEYLCQNNVRINKGNKVGNTPLHLSVAVQTMDVLEELIGKWKMNPNSQNKDGQTPLHTAVLYDRQESMEALLLGGADPHIKDKNGKMAEDLAKGKSIRETLKIYTAMSSAMKRGFIKAKGQQITSALVSKPLVIERVGIILESINIPSTFPTAFYCRREKSENTSVTFEIVEGEKIFSDIFHIKVSDVNRDCNAKINLPLYIAPTEKEELVLRFLSCGDGDHVANEWVIREGVPYCMLETVLIPETACICIIKVRPKKEETPLNTEPHTITSEMETSFAMEIPAGTFENHTILSLQVFDSGQNADMYDSDEEQEDSTHPDKNESELSEQDNPSLASSGDTAHSDDINLAEHPFPTEDTGGSESVYAEKEAGLDSECLITNVYQINVIGDQPNKNVTMQLPLRGDQNIEDLAIVCADERLLHKGGALEVLETKPTVANGNLIFEVSHFCLYFGTFRNFTMRKEDKDKLQRRISMCKDQRQPVTFFAMVKKVGGSLYRHSMVVECCMVNKFNKRLKKWSKKGYKCHETKELFEKEIATDDEFFVNIQGSTELTGEIDGVDRKLKYSGVRSSYKYYEVSVNPDATDGSATVFILEKDLRGEFVTVVELPIVLELPPPPPPPRPPSRSKSGRGYGPNSEEAKKTYPSCAQS